MANNEFEWNYIEPEYRVYGFEMPKKEVKIKPCPFCGENDGEVGEDFHSECYGYKDRYNVQCGKCYATGPIVDSEGKAIKAWNEATR